jgi:uncharacterized protein (TIGR02466 family)
MNSRFYTTVKQTNIKDDPAWPTLLEEVLKIPMAPEPWHHNIPTTYNLINSILDNIRFRDFRDRLEDRINELAKTMLRDTVQEDEYARIYISKSWINVMHQGQRINRHHHAPGQLISGAVYLQNDDSCGLVFSSRIHEDTEIPVLERKSVKINFVEGDLAIFPAQLEHWSEVNQTPRRVILSFYTRLSR